MNPRLQQILRSVERKHPPVEIAKPSGDLTGAIEALIEQRVQERVAAEVDRQRDRLRQHSPRVQFNAPAPSSEPPPRTAPPVDYTCQVIRRSEEGRIEVVELGGKVRMQVQRDSLGRITRMVEIP